MPTPPEKHASDSTDQRLAECEMLATLEVKLNVRFEGRPQIARRVDLDGYSDGPTPVCVEVWAHQGRAKSGQTGKVMRDFAKLLLVEKLLGRPCRKVFAVCDPDSIAFLQNSWHGQFADEFGIERVVVDISEEMRRAVRNAQVRQVR